MRASSSPWCIGNGARRCAAWYGSLERRNADAGTSDEEIHPRVRAARWISTLGTPTRRVAVRRRDGRRAGTPDAIPDDGRPKAEPSSEWSLRSYGVVSTRPGSKRDRDQFPPRPSLPDLANCRGSEKSGRRERRSVPVEVLAASSPPSERRTLPGLDSRIRSELKPRTGTFSFRICLQTGAEGRPKTSV